MSKEFKYNFTTILGLLQDGCKISRKSWKKNVFIKKFEEKIYWSFGVEFTATNKDFFAEDWIVIK